MPRVYLPNPGFEKEFMDTAAVKLAAQVDKEIGTLARSFAPVYTGTGPLAYGDPGDYRDSIKVVVGRDNRVYLVASDWKSVWIEYGTGTPAPTPAFAPLRRAVVASGYRFGEDRRSGFENP